MGFVWKLVLMIMSTLPALASASYASSEYIDGEPGVYYDSAEETGPGVTEPATSISHPPSSFLKDPSVKLLWLLLSSMVAVQEGNCKFCPTYNGIYPNVANCKCYFKCTNGVPIQKWCPPGQKFDVMSMACTFPSKTICAASLLHLLPNLVSNYQQGGNNNMIQQMPPQYQKNQGGNGNFHITVALQKPDGSGGGYGGNMQMPGNMMDMMQMMMMMMQQGMNPNMMMNYNQNMMMNQQNSMNYQQNMMNQMNNQQNMMMNNMQPNMMMNNKYMNQNMNMGNNMNQNMNMGNNMNQNMNMGNNMNQNMNMGNMNQNMNMGDQQNMGNMQNMMDQNMMQTGNCTSECDKPVKKHISITYHLDIKKLLPIRFKLFG